MARNVITPGDVVIATLIGDGPHGPFPHYIEGIVRAIHDEYVTLWDVAGGCEVKIKRHRIITHDQIDRLREELGL